MPGQKLSRLNCNTMLTVHALLTSRCRCLGARHTHASFFFVLLAAFVLGALPTHAAKVFRAGAHSIDISPEALPVIVNGGFLQAQANKVTDRLHARCLVLDDGKTRLVIAVVDTCMMTRELIDEAKELASAATGIPTGRMLISATHTHSAPSVMGCLGVSVDPNYAKWLPGKIAEGIALAAKNLAPARVGWVMTDNWEQTNCRRWITRPDKMQVDPFGEKSVRAMMHPGYENPNYIAPSGPIDPGLTLLSVQSLDGRPLALLANYSMHYFGATAISADYYGKFSEGIGKLIDARDGGPAFVGIMSQGTSGDSHWMDYSQPQKNITLDQYSEAMMRVAADAVKKIQYRDHVSLVMAETKLKLRRRVADESRLAWAQKIVTAMGDRIPKDLAEVYAREQVLIAAEPERELKLQALRIGDLGIAAIPDEVFAITGLKLKAQSPLQPTMNIELANGSEGYIPPPEQHKLGGYTTWAARTAGLEPQAEPRIVETVLGLLEKVSRKKRRKLVDAHGTYAQAVLSAKPLAYWRMNEMVPPAAQDATGHGHTAQYDWRRGVAFYLPGVGNSVGASSQPSLISAAFSGTNQINRAPYFAGGSLEAELKKLGANYSVSFWLWNGLDPKLRATPGIAFARGEFRKPILDALRRHEPAELRNAGFPTGEARRLESQHYVEERLGITGTSAEPGRLFFSTGTSQKPLVGKTGLKLKDWHQVALVREGRRVAVYLDGQLEMEGEASAPASGSTLFFGGAPDAGFTFEGRLDEAAVFNRALSASDIAIQYKASGPLQRLTPPPAFATIKTMTASVSAPPPKFPESYHATMQAMKPAVHWSLRAPPTAFNGERLAPTGTKVPTGAFSVSLWFRNDLANDVRPVTGYFFSRGPNEDPQAPGDHLGIGGNYQSGHEGRLLFFNGNESGQTLIGRKVLVPGSWNQVVLIRDGSHVTAYLNGSAEPEFAGEIDVTAPGAREFFLGARNDNFAPFQGSLAEFAMFDRVLKPSEVALLYQVAEPQPPQLALPTARRSLETPPLSPEESLKKIHVPAGYHVELAAAEPLVLDPVAFDWDERGRLWVVEMADYPLGMDGKGKPGGRVRILEDTDGDGRYDKSTIFADGLNFPTGILTWRGGCLVTAAPDILFLKDSDHDGKADVPQKLFTGFNEGNQQLRVNGLRWGLDGWVYCANGGHHVNYGKEIKIVSALTGEKIALGARDFRFKPDTGEMDPLSGPSQFGRTRDAWGHWFGVQNSYPLWHYVLEDRYLRRNPHVEPPDPKVVLTSGNPPVFPASQREKRFHSFEQSGHFTSACAPMIYSDTLLFGPTREQHDFTCEPFHNLVQHLLVEDDGITFKARRNDAEQPDFFASEDRWCRPVMTRTGPDGALWIADMYRYMIEHPDWLPQNGKDELLPFYRQGDDKGRIYRVYPNGAHPAPFKNLSAMKSSALVKLLESPNGWLRDKAQMMLLWRGDKAVVPALEKMARTSRSPLARMQAVCTLETLGALKDDQLIASLHDSEAGVREQALRVAENHKDDAVVGAAAKLTDDPDAKVRLQLACSLGEWSQPIAGEALARLALQGEYNAIIRGAVLSSLLPHLSIFATKIQSHPGLIEPTFQTALAERRDDVILNLVELPLSDANKADTNALHQVRTVLTLFRAKNTTLEAEAAKHPSEPRWAAVVESKNKLLTRVKISASQASVTEQAFYASLLMCDAREEAAAIEMLGRLLAPNHHLQPLTEHVNRLARSGDVRVPDILMQDWEQRTPLERETILDAIMGREAWVPGLLARARENKLVSSSFDAQRRARLLKHPSAAVRNLATEVFGSTTNGSRQKVIETFRPALSLPGDAAKGKTIFGAACIACHQLEGVGQPIGPDLRSVTQHPADKLLISILDPSADIQPGFMAYFCERNNGEQLYGIIAGETGGSITFKLPDGSTRTILRDDIKSLQSSNVSLMPEGLEATLDTQTLADLIAYLRLPK